jgi:flavin reductase (DIM6/NTAB) family NADH-FMN oxidoreductase RutF
MFYNPLTSHHGLPHDPFKGLVVPRPIAWITSLSAAGVLNVAPYSHYNIVSSSPPAIMFAPDSNDSPDRRKDSHRNVEETGEFVVNIVTAENCEQMNVTSNAFPPDVSEADLAGLATLPSTNVKVPRLAASPIHLECRHVISLVLPTSGRKNRQSVVIGQVVGIHIDERVMTNGLVDISKLKPVTRLGYMDYAIIEQTFRMHRP